MPSGLWISSTSAPNARMVRIFSGGERIRGDDPQRVALDRADERQRRAGAAAGVLDHRLARPQAPGPLGALDHRQRHAVLVRAGRVAALQLDPHLRCPSRAGPPSRTTGVPPIASSTPVRGARGGPSRRSPTPPARSPPAPTPGLRPVRARVRPGIGWCTMPLPRRGPSGTWEGPCRTGRRAARSP